MGPLTDFCLAEWPSAGKVVSAMELLARRLLTKAAQKIGGPELLAKHLGVSTSTLQQWMSTSTLQQWMDGEAIPPAEVLHKAADLVLDDKT
jgi:hypothetical protein